MSNHTTREHEMGDIDTVTGELVSAVKPFGQFLLEQRNGSLHSEISEALQTVAAAVAEHGKAGSLTLTVSIKPMPNGVGQFIVADEIKAKIPEPDRGASLFFVDQNGNLSRSNPRQPELPLREVPARDQTTRKIG